MASDNNSTEKKYGFTTTILHSDRQQPIEHGSLHKPIHTSVAYGYRDANQLASVFQGREPGYRYGRQGNPTVNALEEKITKMEGGLQSICFATGMAAIGALTQALLRDGDHVVSSSYLFGNTNSLWQTVNLQGPKVSMVDATDVREPAQVLPRDDRRGRPRLVVFKHNPHHHQALGKNNQPDTGGGGRETRKPPEKPMQRDEQDPPDPSVGDRDERRTERRVERLHDGGFLRTS